ncbi:MAG TPA: type I DNA topoisomerase [Rhodobiaceae bacterium]|nr:type I DNA topoisomerase [Rhodobiaceae bacterium]
MEVVIVESPAKAKTINKYLGDNFTVLASYGHVRDLPEKNGSVDPDNDFAMSWEEQGAANKRLNEIAKAVKSADRLVLATDPDREGEAISWHVLEVLRKKKVLDGVDVCRVVFNAITRNAVLEAMQNPREIDARLVDAYLARRALDYLVGFNLSPVLWRKLPGSRSAGRVQSVALRLICEREIEIEKFVAREYWTLDTDFLTPENKKLPTRLSVLDGEKLDKFSLANEADAKRAEAAISAATFSVENVESKPGQRNPSPPFTTSTLQQEASRKLGFSASRTMQIAQKLYEGVNIGAETTGLITYMRTDGVQLGSEALASVRGEIGQRFGNRYLPNSPRIYKTAAANAQEAHEAIRPTDISRSPDEIRSYLDYDQQRLYDLIWKRTIASQMESAELDQTAIDISNRSESVMLRASGRVVVFDGYRSVYQEGRDSVSDAPATDERDDSGILPAVDRGEALATRKVTPEQHFTQPPPRFTDASLVKAMEELGIGRPSTYASIIQVLQDRTYVVKDRGKFIPEDRGRLVVTFLNNFFARYVEYDFTAKLEDQLDEVSDGKLDWKTLLARFWRDFKTAIDSTTELTITNVIDVLDEELGPHFFKKDDDGALMRSCPNCEGGRLGLRLGKFGAFIGCSNYPECKFTRQLVTNGEDPDAEAGVVGDRHLGDDSDSGLPVYIRNGPYGPYVQLGDPETKKPKRSSLAKGMAAAAVDLETALKLLSLPRDVGAHPETGDMIQAGLGRYGPYLKYQGSFTSLKDDDDLLEIGLNRAVDLLAESAKKRGRLLGEHPTGGEVHLKAGRFGPYVEHNKLRATLPRGTDMTEVELDQAIELLAAKAAKGGGTAKKGAAKKGAAKKKTAKKAGAKKAAAKKAAS